MTHNQTIDIVLEKVKKWTETRHILLHAGEMSSEELRTVKAVTNAIVREIQGLKVSESFE